MDPMARSLPTNYDRPRKSNGIFKQGMGKSEL
jgi:hypothetical protein